jgi:negative regulator of flagellin synthesis FlgM
VIIQSKLPTEIAGAYQQGVGPGVRAGSRTDPRRNTGRSDRVTLSDQGEELRRLLKAVQDAPDTREEKIRQLRQELQQGTYQVSTAELAERLIQAGGI